jgi:hypothetical protein
MSSPQIWLLGPALAAHASDARREALREVAGEGGPCVGGEGQGNAVAVFGVADQDGAGGVGDFYAVAAVGV